MLRLNPLVRLHWWRSGGESVVFDEVSGGTHQMGELAAVILMLVEPGPVSTRSIVAELSRTTNEPHDRVATALQPAIEQLLAIGLIDIAQE